MSVGERFRLESWVHRPTSCHALALRSRIALTAAKDGSKVQVGEHLGGLRPLPRQL